MNNYKSPPLRKLIERYETQTMLVFKPSKRFYQTTGINRIRFSQITKGEKNPDSAEIKTLSAYFSQFFTVTLQDLI